jgi:hypothetical protein
MMEAFRFSSLQLLALIHILMVPLGDSKPAKEGVHNTPVKIEELDPKAMEILDKSELAKEAGEKSMKVRPAVVSSILI